VDGNTRTKYKLGTRTAGPHKVLSRGEGKISLDIAGYPEMVSSDHVTEAPGPPGDPQTLLQKLGVPQDIVVPEGHQHTGKEFGWEAFEGHEFADDGKLRLWTHWWGYHPDVAQPRSHGPEEGSIPPLPSQERAPYRITRSGKRGRQRYKTKGTVYLPATTVPPTVVALRPKKGGNRCGGPIPLMGIGPRRRPTNITKYNARQVPQCEK